MNRKTKLALGGSVLLLGAITLSGCTASFCTVTDKANILYLLDSGVTTYHATNEEGKYEELEVFGQSTGLYYSIEIDEKSNISKINSQAIGSGVRTPSIYFWSALDQVVLEHAIMAAAETNDPSTAANYFSGKTLQDLKFYGDAKDYSEETMGILDRYGYLKFEDSVNTKKVLWTNWYSYIEEVKQSVSIDDCPNKDYINLYKKTMDSNIAQYRSCLATEGGLYGSYGPNGLPAQIQGKKWTDWKGLLEFLLVWPIGAFLDVLTVGFIKGGVVNGVAQGLAILIATVIIRGLMLLATFKSTQSNAKMQELQPEIQKIQAKYPNSNTNNYEKQRMAEEMQKLYKKNKVNPMSSLLVMIIQFPVFICVWGAMQGSAYLSSGQFLGLRLSDSISSVLFNSSAWATGAGATALVLFLLMSISQAVSMLLPQWFQKRAAKKVAKLGKNPAQNQQNSTMKMFTWVMLIMIIFMGFSLASGLGIYWLIGAVFSIVQTVITQIASNKKQKGRRR